MSLGRVIGASVASQRELVESLSKSKILETHILDDGKSFVRVEGTDFPLTRMQAAAGPVPMFDMPPGGPNGQKGAAFIPEAYRAASLLPGKEAWMPGMPGMPPAMSPPMMSPPMMTPPSSSPPQMFPPLNRPPGGSGGIVPPFMQQGLPPPGGYAPQAAMPSSRGYGNDCPAPRDMSGEPMSKRQRPQDIQCERRAAEGDLEQVCWNYAKGHCSKGDLCRWGHIVPPGYSGPAAGEREAWKPPRAGATPFDGVRPPITPGPGAGLGGGSGSPMGFAKSPAPDDMATETYSSAPPSGGSRVRIVGLSTRPAFNNRIAVCKSFDASASRWEVQLEDGSILRIQEKNMRVISEEGRFEGASSSRLSVGERVRITGLTSRPGLNNRAALCQSHDRASSSWWVLLDDGSTLTVPEDNLLPY